MLRVMLDTNIFDHIIETPGLAGHLRSLTASGRLDIVVTHVQEDELAYYTGDGDDTVVLVDNVRDENFYDTNNQNVLVRCGFFSSSYGQFLDRNAMTIDAFDWLHRTGDNPPHEPTSDLCTSAPARPNLYEGTFAHEYQHLLLSYVDPAETIWMTRASPIGLRP
jgi:hypothetical protein